MKYQVVYFEKAGPENTDETLKLVQEWADMLNIQTVLVASASGQTGVKALERLKHHDVVIVTHSTGFRHDNEQELTLENRNRIEELGGKILTCQHALAGISRAIRFKFKVTVELCLMAADSGLIRTDEDVISVGGTGQGADTAAVIRPANVSRFFDLQVRGVLCKPWEF